MFTGLIEELGTVERVEERAQGRRFWIAAREVVRDARTGDSLACSGCCLTALEVTPAGFAVEAVPETLRLTTLGDWRAGTRVNLERSLRLGDRLGGHLVQGHVDGVSLTVAGLTDAACEIAYIPHTLAVTSAGSYGPGTRVNLEVDLLARYLARMLETAGPERTS